MTKNIITIDLPPHLAITAGMNSGWITKETSSFAVPMISANRYTLIFWHPIFPESNFRDYTPPFLSFRSLNPIVISWDPVSFIYHDGVKKRFRTISNQISINECGSCLKPVTGKTIPRSKSLKPFSRHITSKTHHSTTRLWKNLTTGIRKKYAVWCSTTCKAL